MGNDEQLEYLRQRHEQLSSTREGALRTAAVMILNDLYLARDYALKIVTDGVDDPQEREQAAAYADAGFRQSVAALALLSEGNMTLEDLLAAAEEHRRLIDGVAMLSD